MTTNSDIKTVINSIFSSSSKKDYKKKVIYDSEDNIIEVNYLYKNELHRDINSPWGYGPSVIKYNNFSIEETTAFCPITCESFVGLYLSLRFIFLLFCIVQ